METQQMELFSIETMNEIKVSGDCFGLKTQRLIGEMLKIGVSPRLIAAFLEMTGLQKMHKHYFGAPIVSFKSPWKEEIPDWLKKAVYHERFETICKEHEQGVVGHFAGYTEAVAVIMPASLEFPLSGEWVNIYGWVFTKIGIKYGSKTEEEMKDICENRDLSSDEKRELDRLLVEIREKVIKNHW